MKEEKEIKVINAKIARIQYRLEAKKDKYNQFGKYVFRTAETIYESLKPHLESEGLVGKFEESIRDIQNTKYFDCVFILTDVESGEQDRTYFTTLLDEQLAGMNKAQTAGAVASYCRKYVLCSRFLIDGGDHEIDETNPATTIAAAIDAAATVEELTTVYNQQKAAIEANPELKARMKEHGATLRAKAAPQTINR